MKFDVTTRKKMPSFSQGNNHITDVIDEVTDTFIMTDVVVTAAAAVDHSDHELMCGQALVSLWTLWTLMDHVLHHIQSCFNKYNICKYGLHP